MDRCAGAVARLPESDRKDLAIQALAHAETVSDLAARHEVSRKFVYQQTHKARIALAAAFSPAVADSEVLFELAVTEAWLRQVIVGLTLICRGSYRSVVEFMRDLLGVSISVGCVHDVLQAATRQAGIINGQQDLSGIRVGRPEPAASASVVRTTILPRNWRWPGKPKPRRMSWPATSGRSPSGCAMTFWPWPAQPWPPARRCSTSSSRN